MLSDLGSLIQGERLWLFTPPLMPARDHVSRPAQILCQVFLHLGCDFVRDRVQVLITYPRKSIRRCGVFLLVLLSFAG